MIRLSFVVDVLLILLVEALIGRVLYPHKNSSDSASQKTECRYGYFVLCTAVALISIAVNIWYAQTEDAQRFFIYARAADLGAAVSPVIPVLLLSSAAFIYGWHSLRKTMQFVEPWIEFPFGEKWENISPRNTEVQLMFQSPFHSLFRMAIVVVFCLMIAVYRWRRDLRSFEVSGWDESVWFVIAILSMGVIFSLVRLLSCWCALGKLLKELYGLPMASVFEKLPDPVRAYGNLQTHRPALLDLRAAIWALPLCARNELKTDAENDTEIKGRLNWMFSQPNPIDGLGRVGLSMERTDEKWLADRLTKKATEYIGSISIEWSRRAINEAYGKDSKKKNPDAWVPEWEEEDRQKEQFLATMLVLYISKYLAQLRRLMYSAIIPAPILLIAVASYPFMPDGPRLGIQAWLVGLTLLVVLYVLIQVNKNAFLSRVARTTEDRFTPLDHGFLSSVGQYLIPLGAILAAHFFGLFRFVLEPLFGLFR